MAAPTAIGERETAIEKERERGRSAFGQVFDCTPFEWESLQPEQIFLLTHSAFSGLTSEYVTGLSGALHCQYIVIKYIFIQLCYESMDAIQPAAYKKTIKFVFYCCRDPIPSHSKRDTMKKLWKKSKKDINDPHISDYFISARARAHTSQNWGRQQEDGKKAEARNLFACTFEETSSKKRHLQSRHRITNTLMHSKNIMKYLLLCSLFRINKICISSCLFFLAFFFSFDIEYTAD